MIPDIDSSKWKTDPRAFGMSPRVYIRSDTIAFFKDFLGRSKLNTFFNFTALANRTDRWVVSPNLDTIYSFAVVNASKGFTLTLPDVGSRFIATQIITENHMTPFYLYGGGTHHFSAGDFDTEFVMVGVRIGTDGTPEDVKKIVTDLQPQYRIESAATGGSLPDVDMDKLKKTRAALVKEYSKLPNSFGAMVKHTDEVKDWEYFTYVTAGAWGLSPDENAMYVLGGPRDAKGGACYTATFGKVPAEAFFSITAYNPEKYLMTDEDNVLSSNRHVVSNADGTFSIAFGSEKCRSLAPNYVATPEDGWNILLRAYKPDVAAFKAYKMPEFKKVE
jgi:hypothetical protein